MPMKRKIEVTPENQERVRALAAYGNTIEEIAKLFGCSERLIKRRFQPQLTLGRAQGKANILKTGYDMAVGLRNPDGTWKEAPDKAVLIFMLKARGGLREYQRTELVGPDGKPIQPVVVNVSGEGKASKPVLVVPGMWSEDMWNARAREHQALMFKRMQAVQRK